MALVTVQRSPSVSSCSSPPTSESGVSVTLEEGEGSPDGTPAKTSRSLSECYFAGKGAALVIPSNDKLSATRRVSASGSSSDIQQHLQSMFYLLRPEETLKMAVKLESVHASRTRYLVVVSCVGKQNTEESCLLGIDHNDRTTVGLVLKVLADTSITLDGDGGFSVSVCGQQHIFKPVSVQAMWSALQTLHKVSSKAREQNYFLNGLSHEWVSYYEQRIESDRSCLNEWHAMDDLESRRPPSPDSVRTKPLEREETERVIRSTLKEIMMSVDLDEVTSKYIRSRLEEDLDMDLAEYKSFIDQEMLTILGQMDAATEVFDHVYLGSEWNASNYEELQKNGVGHILNVTREIDNFFPGMFDYLNVRVYDDDKTDLLKHWDNTFKYISRAKRDGSKVLVHCKMGVSRSASVVIAYAMKAFSWDFKKAMDYVKEKRNCIKPNANFIAQLETYQGILEAMKNREKLLRSKSETNLGTPAISPVKSKEQESTEKRIQTQHDNDWVRVSGKSLAEIGSRPKSWSPESCTNRSSLCASLGPASVSLEQLNLVGSLNTRESSHLTIAEAYNHNMHVRMPCNGEAYSVSPNKILYLPACSSKDNHSDQGYGENESDDVSHKTPDTFPQSADPENHNESSEQEPTVTQTKPMPQMLTAVLVKKEIWDPGDPNCRSVVWTANSEVRHSNNDLVYVSELKVDLPETNEKTNLVSETNLSGRTLQRKEGDPFSAQVDRVFEREERKQVRPVTTNAVPQCMTESYPEVQCRDLPSRQSSWSSYDSAVVLTYQGENRDTPSRQSSWGSGDTRWNCGGGTLPSRNSSWGSYDIRPSMQYVTERGEKEIEGSSGLFPYDKDEIPWHPGTVKRTKQKLEEGTATVKRVCQDSHSGSPLHYASSPTLSTPELQCEPLSTAVSQPNIILGSAITSSVEVSTSPPITNSTSECTSLQENKVEDSKAENENTEEVVTLNEVTKDKEDELGKSECQRCTLGLVKNLKKEFEAKSFVNKTEKTNSDTNTSASDARCSEKPKKVRSLPSSPVSVHHPETRSPGSSEDLSVRTLVGRYEVTNRHRVTSENEAISRPDTHSQKSSPDPLRSTSVVRPPQVEAVRSSIQPKNITQNIINNQRHKSYVPPPFILCEPKTGESRRPPVPHVRTIMGPTPNAVVATVVAKAASKKQQQGKTHPLARLTINKTLRENPVYNTM